MSDRVFQIEFRTTATGNGAQQLLDDIDKIKDAVGETNASLNTNDVSVSGGGERAGEQIQKDLDLVREKTAGIKTELAATTNEAGKLLSQAGPLKSALTGLNQSLDGNAIGGLANSFRSFMSNSAGVVSRITAIGTALIAGGKMAVEASTTWAKAIADIILYFDPLMKGAADASGALRKLEGTKLSLREQAKEVEGLIDKFNELDAKGKKAMESISRLDSAETNLGKARIDNELQTGLAGTSDPGQQSALRAKAEKSKAELDAGLSLRQADRELEALKGQQKAAEEQIIKLLDDTKAGRDKINTAELLIYQYAQALGVTYSQADALAKDANLLQEKINLALASSASESEKTAVIRAAKGLPAAVDLRDEAAKSVAPADAQIGQLRDLLASIPNEIKTAMAVRETVAFESNTQSTINTMGFKASLDDLQQSLVNATARLNVAQLNNSAAQTGNGDISKTYPAMQDAQAEVQRIKQMISELSSGAAGYTGVLNRVSADTTTALSSGGTSIAQAGQQFTSGASKLAEDADIAANIFTETAGAASGVMASAISNLGNSVNNSFQNMANRVEDVARNIDSRMANLESKLADVAADTRSASRNAEIALSQIKNAM